MKELFAKINVKRLLSYALYLFLSLVAQNMLFTELRPFGVCLQHSADDILRLFHSTNKKILF